MFPRQALLRSARAAAPQRAFFGQVRTFAAPASSEKVNPPVALFGLDGTYATALVRAPGRPIGLFFGDPVEDTVLEGTVQALNCPSAADQGRQDQHG
jgi:hypothetical protein